MGLVEGEMEMDLPWSVELKRSPKGRELNGKDYYQTEARAEAAKADLLRRGFEVGKVQYEPGVASDAGVHI